MCLPDRCRRDPNLRRLTPVCNRQAAPKHRSESPCRTAPQPRDPITICRKVCTKPLRQSSVPVIGIKDLSAGRPIRHYDRETSRPGVAYRCEITTPLSEFTTKTVPRNMKISVGGNFRREGQLGLNVPVGQPLIFDTARTRDALTAIDCKLLMPGKGTKMTSVMQGKRDISLAVQRPPRMTFMSPARRCRALHVTHPGK